MRHPALAVLILLATLPPVSAGPLHLRYEAYWGGLHAADFTLSLERDETAYRSVFHLQTRGLIDWLIGLRVNAESRGRRPLTGGLESDAYRVDYENRRRARTIEVAFAEDPARAVITTRSETEKTEPGPDLDPALRSGVIDPLAALGAALDRIPAGSRRFTLAVFDGKRRFDLDGERLAPTRRRIGRETHAVDVLRLTTRPVAGFRDSTRVLWDGTTFDLYIARDGAPVPLQIDAVGPGPMITLTEVCDRPCPLAEGD